MDFHPIADILPLMPESELESLARDIRENGLLNPIIMHEGKILDGRNRFLACRKAGVEPRFENTQSMKSSPVKWVLSQNLHRRHLNESQRAMVAARVANMKQGRPEKSSIGDFYSQAETADMLNVGKRTVERAQEVIDTAEPEQIKQIESGEATVSGVLREKKRERIMSDLAEPEPPTEKTLGTFPILYADPPWQYEHVKTENRSIENHYPTLSLEAICNLPIEDIAGDDCVLFLWATSPKLQEAFEVLNAWGFQYRTCAVWNKEKIGMGYYFRQMHELLLVAVRGNLPTPLPEHRPPSVITAPRKAHSEKPPEVYEIIEKMYPDIPKLELFARKERPGWKVWGNQI